MTKRMLIDTSHPEETRVVVISGNRLDDFDYESAARKQLKGNIYLAKVARVEPSLQAAFVEYGGNRHGFLPFSEIHPDYYRIPIADREAVIAAEAEAETEIATADPGEEADDEDTAAPEEAADGEADAPPQGAVAGSEDAGGEDSADDGDKADGGDTSDDGEAGDEEQEVEARAEAAVGANGAVEELAVEPKVDTLGGDDVEDAARRRAKLMRRYKIQEVIKRRQVILVQVTKEERGNKGAALTTYLSLAGRYCVLMPNTARGGGISRKIAAHKDRRRLKSILESLNIPEGIAVIVRTAGSERTKAEIRRDYEFLLRLWDEIRSTTLESTAPALIYEEASLIKRAIRDIYQSDTDEILVEGDEGYKAAKAFMKSLTPSHARKVKQYKDPAIPLFYRHQIESQIDAMHNPVVQLRSGGYIVMHMTEALVAIDVNSGKATRERHIEETAYKTNMEAADEVARQLRLRDLAGLIVIDFIDMEESRHNRSVERKLKDAMRQDRARIQLGRISPFGLLEMSRQRLRPSLLESSTEVCRYCSASGYVRTTESVALHVLRGLEEEGIRRGGGELTVSAPRDAALHLLNRMRDRLVGIEERYGLHIDVFSDEALIPPNYTLRRSGAAPAESAAPERPRAAASERSRAAAETEEEDRGERRRGRGRRRRKKATAEAPVEEVSAAVEAVEPAAEGEEQPAEDRAEAAAAGTGGGSEAEKPRRRRRGKRGGRRRTRRGTEDAGVTPAESAGEAADSADARQAADEPEADTEAAAITAPPPTQEVQAQEVLAQEDRPTETGARESDDAKPKPAKAPRRRRSPRRAPAPADAAATGGEDRGPGRETGTVTTLERPEADPAPEPVAAAGAGTDGGDPGPDAQDDDALDEAAPKRRGWWNRWS